jgi:hypothetical protein
MQLVATNSATTVLPIFVEAEVCPEPRKRRTSKPKTLVPENFKRHLKPSTAALALAKADGLPRSELSRLAKAATTFKWKLGDAPLADAMARAIRADRTLSPRQREDRLKRLTADLKAAAQAEYEALRVEAAAWVERVNAFEADDKARQRKEAAEKRAHELGVQTLLRQFQTWKDEAGDYRPQYAVYGDAHMWAMKNSEHQRVSRMNSVGASRGVQEIFREANVRPAKSKGKVNVN